MNFAQLNYVLALARTGSFTAAADECHVTQPTLSNSIAQLEAELQNPIFLRTTRSVSLTAFGQYILPFVEKIMNCSQELNDASLAFNEPLKKIIQIGKSPLMSFDYLARVLHDFKLEHQETEVVLYEKNFCQLYDLLKEGSFDYVFDIGDIHNPTFSMECKSSDYLYKEPLYFIPKAGTPIKNAKSVTLHEVANETFVMVADDCSHTKIVRELFRKYNYRLKEYSGKALCCKVLAEWAHCGLGAAILPKSALGRSSEVSYVLKDDNDEDIMVAYKAIWKNMKSLPEYVSAFQEYLRYENR